MRRWTIFALALLAGCAQPPVATAPPADEPLAPAPEGMVAIKGGTFTMGSDEGIPNEAQVQQVTVKDFYMDEHEVTVAQFRAFVEATGYVTTAEKPPEGEWTKDVPAELMVPGALIFRELGEGNEPDGSLAWWSYKPGANWRHPGGPDTTAQDDHPVVQVSWDDAQAYAKWAGKSLPSEAQWEYAARAGRNVKFIWGDDEFDPEKPQANIWQGQFPQHDLSEDGFTDTAPVKSFAPTPNGLYDMAGNVWEWTSTPDSNSPETAYVVRGGSFLCAPSSCQGYRPTARMSSSPDTGLMHTGFRCVINP